MVVVVVVVVGGSFDSATTAGVGVVVASSVNSVVVVVVVVSGAVGVASTLAGVSTATATIAAAAAAAVATAVAATVAVAAAGVVEETLTLEFRLVMMREVVDESEAVESLLLFAAAAADAVLPAVVLPAAVARLDDWCTAGLRLSVALLPAAVLAPPLLVALLVDLAELAVVAADLVDL